MAGDPANGRIKGSRSTAPFSIACRVEYASNVAALCCTADRIIQLLRDGSLSTPIGAAGLSGKFSGMRMVDSGSAFCGAGAKMPGGTDTAFGDGRTVNSRCACTGAADARAAAKIAQFPAIS